METTQAKQPNKQEKQQLFETVRSTKIVAVLFVSCCLLSILSIFINGIFVIWFENHSIEGFVGTFAILILAAPTMIGLVFKFGGKVDLGPCFVSVQSRVGNTIYEYWVRDEMMEATQNILVTFGKYLLLLLLSIFITPIVAIISCKAYKKAYRDAEAYAEENQISKKEIPGINKMITTPLLTVFWLFIGAYIVITIVMGMGDSIKQTLAKADAEKNLGAKFADRIASLPEEYYAESNISTPGWVAAFKLDDGRQVYCGLVQDNNQYIKGNGIYKGGRYFIIDGTVYVSNTVFGDSWELMTDEETEEYLLGRHLHAVVGDAPQYSDSKLQKINSKEFYFRYYLQNGKEGGIVDFDQNETLRSYARIMDFSDPESQYDESFFVLKDGDLATLKATAKEIAP